MIYQITSFHNPGDMRNLDALELAIQKILRNTLSEKLCANTLHFFKNIAGIYLKRKYRIENEI
jgi:hypothetical protein